MSFRGQQACACCSFYVCNKTKKCTQGVNKSKIGEENYVTNIYTDYVPCLTTLFVVLVSGRMLMRYSGESRRKSVLAILLFPSYLQANDMCTVKRIILCVSGRANRRRYPRAERTRRQGGRYGFFYQRFTQKFSGDIP